MLRSKILPNLNLSHDFAHPTEEEFAAILNYYRISWEYEPNTFELDWDENGNVKEAFSPDFYLPQQDLYIELTTLKPSLTRIKNRKVKMMRELYPDINIKLFKRKDLRNLLIKFGIDKQAKRIQGTEAQKRST
jgi:hypoxanthine phosphoribosyltransferase